MIQNLLLDVTVAFQFLELEHSAILIAENFFQDFDAAWFVNRLECVWIKTDNWLGLEWGTNCDPAVLIQAFCSSNYTLLSIYNERAFFLILGDIASWSRRGCTRHVCRGRDLCKILGDCGGIQRERSADWSQASDRDNILQVPVESFRNIAKCKKT